MITFDNLEFDLGNVAYGQSKSVDVNIDNSGSIPATLKSLNSSCSCTSGHLNYSTLQPNSKGLYTITLNSTKAGKGKQAKSIDLQYTIGKENFSQTFRIKANVI